MKEILGAKTKHSNIVNWRKLSIILLGVMLVTSANALPFNYTEGDLCLGFRKTGIYAGNYEIVVDIGPATNYIRLAAGTITNITQYVASQVDPDSYGNLTNLTWSVTGETFDPGTFPAYPLNTLWVTVPRANGVSAPAAVRANSSTQGLAVDNIESILGGAVEISSELASNQDNTATCVQEPYSIANNNNYGYFMADPNNSTLGTLNGNGPLNTSGRLINLENTTVAPFSTPAQSDFYQLVPTGSTDPQSGTTTGAGYNVGYFQLNTDGSMTFTRASATVQPPVAGFTGSPTNGFVSLQVTFTDTSTGTITNWLWNFGDGHSVTNTSNASVNHTYALGGKYTVSLTATGPGGANTSTRTAYVVVSPLPGISTLTVSGGNLVFSGTNCPIGQQYRILTSTNLTSGNWKPVATNFFLSNGNFSYTNSTTNLTSFFRLISP